MNCEQCNKEINDNEYVNNWGWCGECFDADFSEYAESVSGPFDWLRPKCLHF